jgi:hypothetical protein
MIKPDLSTIAAASAERRFKLIIKNMSSSARPVKCIKVIRVVSTSYVSVSSEGQVHNICTLIAAFIRFEQVGATITWVGWPAILHSDDGSEFLSGSWEHSLPRS